jgi:hypothetical protein
VLFHRLVYYSLVVTDQYDAYERRWIRSVRSLRQFNCNVPVELFVFNTPPDSLRAAADRYDVVLRPCGDYREHLSQAAGAQGEALKCMPTLQKLLPLSLIDRRTSQILYLDCDTFFLSDVDSLFRKYTNCDWYAREEPSSRRSVLFPYDRRHVDEDALLHLAKSLKVNPVPPYNFGVFLFNDRVHHALLTLRKNFFSLVWKFSAGASLTPDIKMPPELRTTASKWIETSGGTPIAYPSRNFWILDQVALWLTLGKVPNLSHGLFAVDDVLQGIEFLLHRSYAEWCTVVHYYGVNETLFFSEASFDALQSNGN